MRSLVFVLSVSFALAACAPGYDGVNGVPGPQGPPGPTATPTPSNPVDQVQVDINDVVADENAYREGLGQTGLTAGLSCSVVAIASGAWISSSSPGYNAGQGVLVAVVGTPTYTYLYQGPFNQPNIDSGPNNLLPIAIQPIYIGQNYKISCSGQIAILSTKYYAYDIQSDDGSILTIDGTQVINNDGNHGVTEKQGTKFLRRGIHSFSLVYAQSGGGNFAMMLKSDGASIDSRLYVH